MGARFAKWRAVIAIGDGLPSWGCMEANAHALARYAALCQEAGLVPVVEPEVIMDGEHTLQQCRESRRGAANGVQRLVRAKGRARRHDPEAEYGACRNGLAQVNRLDEVADATVSCFLRAVPAAVPAIAFLSGGQSGGVGVARSECDERPIQVALAVGADVLVRPRHPAAGVGNLEWPPTNIAAAQRALFIVPAAIKLRVVANTHRRWRQNDRKQA